MADARPALASFEDGWGSAAHLPDPRLSFPEAFGGHLLSAPDATAFTVVKTKGRELVDRAFSFREVDLLARRAAIALGAEGLGENDRVILSLRRCEDFFVYFLAAQRLGAVPVPLPALDDGDVPAVFRERVRSVAGDCAPRLIVVDSARAWETVAGSVAIGRSVLDASRFDLRAESTGEPPPSAPPSFERLAFLQYTSGSTGDPKGVAVDHYNLVANFRAVAEAARMTAADRSFSWLPVFHDMGLIGGFLLGVYMRTSPCVMATRYFVGRPDSWLRAIDRYRATYTVAPNFAYSLVARRLPDSAFDGLDLSCLRLAFDGAEPIDPETLELFAARLAPRGLAASCLFPVYGLAECTLAAAFPLPGSGATVDVVDADALSGPGRAQRVTAPRTADDGRTLRVVSVGRALPGHRVRILARDENRALDERTVGEIAISGPSLTRGYFGREPRESDELRTGDLGYLAGGELYVVDRLKDVVIIGGRNFSPSDIEHAVGDVDGIVRGAVVSFGARGEGTEELVVIAAIHPDTWRTVDELQREVQRRVQDRIGVRPHEVCIVRPGTIPRTSSGKVRRDACRKLWDAGALDDAEGLRARVGIKAGRLRQRLALLVGAGARESDFPPPPGGGE